MVGAKRTGESSGGENPIIFVPVESVVVGQRQRQPDSLSIERLADSMVEVGLLHPIGVTPQKVLIYGATRLAAAKKLGWEAIAAREFVSAEDPEIHALMEWEENDARRNLNLEEQLKYKRKVIDPILKAQARQRQSAAGVQSASNLKGGTQAASGKLPQAGDAKELGEAGRVRDMVGRYLDVSGRTLEKFEQLAVWSEDESLPVEVQQAAREGRERANTLGKVDGEFKQVKALKDRIEKPTDQAKGESSIETRFVRGYSAFEALLEQFDPTEVGPALAKPSWDGLKFVLDSAAKWVVEAEKSREG